MHIGEPIKEFAIRIFRRISYGDWACRTVRYPVTQLPGPTDRFSCIVISVRDSIYGWNYRKPNKCRCNVDPFTSLILLRAFAPSEVFEEKEDDDKAIGDDFYNYSTITT